VAIAGRPHPACDDLIDQDAAFDRGDLDGVWHVAARLARGLAIIDDA